MGDNKGGSDNNQPDNGNKPGIVISKINTFNILNIAEQLRRVNNINDNTLRVLCMDVFIKWVKDNFNLSLDIA